MNLVTLATSANLKLAWRRVTTGSNHAYKRYFRHLYYAYELALDDNLAELQEKIQARAWQPHSPERVYMPKATGLQRPLTLLHLEDQIVLQAVANICSNKVVERRRPFLRRSVFSNIPKSPRNIFFLNDWHRTYAAFSSHVEKQYASGLVWVADFDLAAFYETISHDLLLRTVFPRLRQTADTEWVSRCFATWTSQRYSDAKGHGLPQGPIASDFLAEVFLLPVDVAMQQVGGYVRYVDDVRLFAQTENEIRRAVIKLEIHCRERGLIPQVGKFAIRRAKSLSEARGMLPSIGSPSEGTSPRLSPKQAERLLKPALGGRPLQVIDKSRLRYVLYRARPSNRLLSVVCRLLPRHPEHTDAFVAYLSQHEYRKTIRDCCLAVLSATPYDYVAGEMWHVLARFYQEKNAFSPAVRGSLVRRSKGVLRDNARSVGVKWGAAHFVCSADRRDGGRHANTLRAQRSSLLQALVSPALPIRALDKNGVARWYLRRDEIEPGISLAGPLHDNGLSVRTLGLRASDLPRQVRHVFGMLGLVRKVGKPIDIVGEIIAFRFGVGSDGEWKRLLGAEYSHAAGILVQAEAVFWSGASHWLSHQSSFNQVVFLALQRRLQASGAAGVVATRTAKGDLADYGVTLDPSNAFSKAYPVIADAFRKMNARRNKLPGSHPYEKKTAAQTSYLKPRERNAFVAQLRNAYAAILPLCP